MPDVERVIQVIMAADLSPDGIINHEIQVGGWAGRWGHWPALSIGCGCACCLSDGVRLALCCSTRTDTSVPPTTPCLPSFLEMQAARERRRQRRLAEMGPPGAGGPPGGHQQHQQQLHALPVACPAVRVCFANKGWELPSRGPLSRQPKPKVCRPRTLPPSLNPTPLLRQADPRARPARTLEAPAGWPARSASLWLSMTAAATGALAAGAGIRGLAGGGGRRQAASRAVCGVCNWCCKGAWLLSRAATLPPHCVALPSKS